KRLRLMQALDDLEQGQKAGRHQWLQQQLALFGTAGTDDEKVQTRLQALRTAADAVQQNVALARRLLTDLPGRLESTGHRAWLTEATAAIRTGLHPDNVNRLEAFTKLAGQAEKQPSSRTTDQKPEQLLALAVTGWLQGGGAAETRPEVAARLWQARQLILE